MTLALHNLKQAAGARKKKKRVGRGNSSGRGTYSGRGLKGQKARAGASGLKRLGLKLMLRKIPKKRGFKSPRPKPELVYISDLDAHYKSGEEVSPETLRARRLATDPGAEIKILSRGRLKTTGLVVRGVMLSAGARREIEEKGGRVAGVKNR